MALASEMRSRTELMPEVGFTSSRYGTETIAVIGAKSRRASYGALGTSIGVETNALLLANSSVRPSGADFATRSPPMVPVAPGRLSMMTGTPRRSESFWPTMRATVSVGPPGAFGTISLIGCVVYGAVYFCDWLCANSGCAAVKDKMSANADRTFCKVDFPRGAARYAAAVSTSRKQLQTEIYRGVIETIVERRETQEARTVTDAK